MQQTVMHKTQEALIGEHLKSEGSISGVEAAAIYKVRSLTRRIRTLREGGMKIQSVWCKDTMGQRYVRYRYMGMQPPQKSFVFPVHPEAGAMLS